MNSLYLLRYQEILDEFDQYVLEHPDFAVQLPNQAQLVFVDEKDPEFSHWSVETFGHPASHDDLPNRPIVFIEIGELAPRRSRLLTLRIMDTRPRYVTA
jgi:hypothetical protein